MKTKTETSVKTGLLIVRKAIKRNLSLSEASRQSGYGRNYVSDVRLRLNENYIKSNVSEKNYLQFSSLIGRVEKIKILKKKLDNLKKV